MSERFYLTATPAEIRKQFKVERVPAFKPQHNISPPQSTPIVITEAKDRRLVIARWGLVPAWSRDLSLSSAMIIAQAETLEEKPAYREALQWKRCLVPANGFYEWQLQGANRQPYRVGLRTGALIGFAGLWAKWTPESGEAVETFTIITTQASRLVSEVHNRMPVIIAPIDYRLWLTASIPTAKKLLVPYASGLTLTPVTNDQRVEQ
jgi:putative SOS response-associated peptidase YedK